MIERRCHHDFFISIMLKHSSDRINFEGVIFNGCSKLGGYSFNRIYRTLPLRSINFLSTFEKW